MHEQVLAPVVRGDESIPFSAENHFTTPSGIDRPSLVPLVGAHSPRGWYLRRRRTRPARHTPPGAPSWPPRPAHLLLRDGHERRAFATACTVAPGVLAGDGVREEADGDVVVTTTRCAGVGLQQPLEAARVARQRVEAALAAAGGRPGRSRRGSAGRRRPTAPHARRGGRRRGSGQTTWPHPALEQDVEGLLGAREARSDPEVERHAGDPLAQQLTWARPSSVRWTGTDGSPLRPAGRL